MTRYREERDIARAVITTGAAVALCSWTTIVGYGSLLAARNQALQGFGVMAIIGEVACLFGRDRRAAGAAALAGAPAGSASRPARDGDNQGRPAARSAGG